MRKIWRVLFSRYMLSALLIMLEIGIATYLIFEVSYYSIAVLLFVATIDFLVVLSIINADYNPEYRVTWMAIVMLIPILGALLYILFRRRSMSKREQRLAHGILTEINKYGNDEELLFSLADRDPLARGKACGILAADPSAKLYTASSARFYRTGEEMFESMLEALGGAEHFIFLEYFIINEGEMWDKIHSLLLEKVKAGVEVRVMYDDIGCMRTLPAKYDAILEAEGISAVRFSPVNPRVTAVHNNRDHRKILVVDGKIAFTGGINLADEYINRIERFGYWKDGGVSVTGKCVQGFTKLFLTLWDMSRGTVSDYTTFLEPTAADHGKPDGGYYIPFGSGPQPMYLRKVGKRAFIDVINQAKKYVYITTPYLIIDFDLTEALAAAAERGVDVRIITPAIPDKKMVKVMTKSAYPRLMSSDVRIYEYTPGFIHMKSIVADDEYAIIGTINFDYRSLVHHFEDALWMYSSPEIARVRNDFIETLKVSREMTPNDAKLSPFEWFVKCGLRIFAPLL